jgi:hypothetical protein
MIILFHSIPIISPHKFADVAENLMLMTLPTEIGLRLGQFILCFLQFFRRMEVTLHPKRGFMLFI